MKVMLIGESMRIPSGFGTQLKLLAEGLHERGHEVVVLAQSGVPWTSPKGVEEWNLSSLLDLDKLDPAIHEYAPDAVIVFSYIFQIAALTQLQSSPANCPTYFWMPWEASTLPIGYDQVMSELPEGSLIHLSNYADKMWKPYRNCRAIIPHCYNPAFDIQPEQSVKELRRKWSEKFRFPLFDDAYIVFCGERNIEHKRWDLTYDYISKLSDELEQPVYLIAHTQMKGDVVTAAAIKGYDLKDLESKFKLDGKICYTGFDWINKFTEVELTELLKLSDIRITTSGGEGFGLFTVECAAARCLQIINNSTTMEEIMGFDHQSLVEPAGRFLQRNGLWQAANVEGMVKRTLEFIEHPEIIDDSLNKAKNRSKEFFTHEKMIDNWERVLKEDQEEDKKLHWINHRWGYNNKHWHQSKCRALIAFLQKINPNLSILELGSTDGYLTECALSVGMTIQALEQDERFIDKVSKRTQQYTTHTDYIAEWPKADVLVITDQFEDFYSIEPGLIQTVLDRMIKYTWVCTRVHPSYKWGVPLFDYTIMKEQLENNEFTRRHDLEILAEKDFDIPILHQVWYRGPDPQIIPSGLVKPDS